MARAVKRIAKKMMQTNVGGKAGIDLTPIEQEARQRERRAGAENIVKIFDVYDLPVVDIVLEPMKKDDSDAIENVYGPEDGNIDYADRRYWSWRRAGW